MVLGLWGTVGAAGAAVGPLIGGALLNARRHGVDLVCLGAGRDFNAVEQIFEHHRFADQRRRADHL